MTIMEKSPSAIAPLLLKSLVAPIFIHVYKTLIYLSEQHKFIQFLHSILVGFFLFILTLLPSHDNQEYQNYPSLSKNDKIIHRRQPSTSAVARSLSQLLQIMNDIPVSSRKYEVVRSLAEKLIDENNNLLEGGDVNQGLREINCAVLSEALGRSLRQLEAAAVYQRRTSGGGGGGESDDYCVGNRVSRLLSYGRVAWSYAKSRNELSRPGSSAEKLAAEVLWLAQKMAACGCVEEAVREWASAEKLAWLALSAEPRLQGSLVKVSAFLIKEAKEIGNPKDAKIGDQQHARQIKLKILVSWLPLLCRATNGTDAPILNIEERTELERILEEIISTLEEEDEQERVLSLWLHHFTYCPTSDWPNLRPCYTRWLNASRTRLVLAIDAPIS